jgi:two-component system, OmpR family, phosphate regulon response regulator OmpR
MNTIELLLVEDDLRLRDLLERYLSLQEFNVRGVANIAGMRKVLREHHIQLIVLDLMLPDGDGLSVCRQLRGEGNEIPIIMLTAKGDDVDRIVGLEIGADDYLTKPCNPRELVARIRAVLRRAPRVSVLPDHAAVCFGDFTFAASSRTLTKAGQAIRLTSGESALLSALTAHAGQPLTRDKLIGLTKGSGIEPFDRSIDVMVVRLRKLLEEDPKNPRWLQTVWGVGYAFTPGPVITAPAQYQGQGQQDIRA